MKKTWSIGELNVSLGPPMYQKSMVWISEENTGAQLSSPDAIRSRSMQHAMISALDLDKQISCFVRAIRAQTAESTSSDSDSQADVVLVSRDCLVKAFLFDIASYYNGRFQVEQAAVRSRTLAALAGHGDLSRLVNESFENESLKSIVSEELGSLVAALRCCATSLDLQPWWNPFSRKHSVRKDMREAVTDLENTWQNPFDEEVISEKQRELRTMTKEYIKSRKKTWIRARGRYRAALEHLHSPNNVARYPASAAFGPSSARVRDEHTMTSKSEKRKKCFTQQMSPKQRHDELADVARHLKFGTDVRVTAERDRDVYFQASDSVVDV